VDLGVHRRREPRQSFFVPLWSLRSSCRIPGPPPALSHPPSDRPTDSVRKERHQRISSPNPSFLFSPPLTYPRCGGAGCHPQGTERFQSGARVLLVSVLRKTKKKIEKKKLVVRLFHPATTSHEISLTVVLASDHQVTALVIGVELVGSPAGTAVHLRGRTAKLLYPRSKLMGETRAFPCQPSAKPDLPFLKKRDRTAGYSG
jgi:hypothetical protein